MSLDFDDLMGLLDPNSDAKVESVLTDKPKAEEKKEYSNDKFTKDKQKKQNKIWDDLLEAKEIDSSKITKDKVFTLISMEEALPNDLVLMVSKITEVLNQKGFKFRYNGFNSPIIHKVIYDKFGDNSEVYLPWKKGFENFLFPVSTSPTETAGAIAKFYTKYNKKEKKPSGDIITTVKYGFSSVPPAIRTLLSNSVHLLLGKDCDKTLSFLIVYSECGTETVKEIDYKKTHKNLPFYIKVAEASNIPVFNLGKANAVERLVKYISSL